MRPAAAVRIEDPITIDHLVIFVFEQRKIELSVKSLSQHLAEFFRLRVRIDADGKNLNSLLLLFCQKTFQLPELFYAERSPIAAVKNQNHGFFPAEIR